MRRPTTMLAVLAALGTLSGVFAGPAVARSHMEIGLQDDQVFLNQYWYGRTAGLARAHDLHVTWLRSNLVWTRALTNGGGSARKRPKHVRYDVSRWDQLIDAAAAQGIRVELTLTGPSPRWATPHGRGGPFAPRLSDWHEFVRRMVTHFKGRVSRYEIWNEPNWVGWLQPMREAPYSYRGLYQTAWSTIHKTDPKAQVLIGDTSPYVVPHKAWAPLTFLRAMACVNGHYKRLKGCKGTLVADGYAHHPYHYQHGPTYKYPGANNVTIGTLGRLTSALDKLRKAHALRTRNNAKMPVYLTEFGYFTFGYRGLPESKRAKYEAQAFSIAQRNPRVRQMLHYQLVEPQPGPYAFWKTYLIRSDGVERFSFYSLASWADGAAASGRVATPGGPLSLPAVPRSR